MYILLVSRGYPTDKYKMNGIFEFDQAKALVDAGCKVVYAAVDVRSILRWRRWGVEKRILDGVLIYAINIPGGRIPSCILSRIKLFGLQLLYRKIEKEQGKPDVLHAHFTEVGYTASQFNKAHNIPFIITEHNSLMISPIIEKRLMSIARIAYDKADTVISVSPALANVISKKFLIEAKYIPNIVDTSTFTYSVHSNSNSKNFNFVSIGGLIYRKGMDLTISAFYQVFKEISNVTLTIYGEGPERLKLVQLINNYGLSDRIFLKGLCSRLEIAEKLEESDCFVLASRAETFGVAYIEAMATGLPVIATKCGGPESFVTPENGILITVDDIEALKNAMISMYHNNTNYNREEISNYIYQRFSPQAIAKMLMQIYEDTCKLV